MDKFIEYGELKRMSGNGLEEVIGYEMYFLDQSNINEIIRLQDMVSDYTQNKELFVSDPRDFILNEVLQLDKGRAIGVFVENQLIAYRTITFPGKGEWNLGKELDLSEESLEKVVNLEATVVHPDYRGNRLQAKMLAITIQHVEELGYDYLFSTVSPFNYPSLKSVMDAGLKIYSLDKRGGVYGGKWRFLLRRNLRELDHQQFESIVKVENTDLTIQMELLKKDYVGHIIKKIENDSSKFIIHYGLIG